MKDYVKLRQRQRKDCVALYLDIYYKGKRKCETLNLYLVPEKTREDKKRNKETLLTAESIRAEKLISINNKVFQFKSEEVYLYKLFDDIINEKKVKNTHSNWVSALIYLKRYSDDILISNADKAWCEGFVRFLDNYRLQKGTETVGLSNNTKCSYFRKLKAAFNEAVKKGYIKRSPCVDVDAPKEIESERCYLTIDELVKMNSTECSD